MGLLTSLASLPLAPVKGLVWLARQIEQQAEQERDQETGDLQAALLELQLLHDMGDGEEELARKESELLEKVGVAAGSKTIGGEGE